MGGVRAIANFECFMCKAHTMVPNFREHSPPVVQVGALRCTNMVPCVSNVLQLHKMMLMVIYYLVMSLML